MSTEQPNDTNPENPFDADLPPVTDPKPNRNRITAIWLGLVLISAGVLAFTALGNSGEKDIKPALTLSTAAIALPAAADQTTGAWMHEAPTAGLPLLTIWQDPQCPHCAKFEEIYGPVLDEMRANKLINIEYRMVSFLDGVMPKSNLSSHRAVNAIGCALDQETTLAVKLHKLLYANQPAEEGTGWTDDQLFDLADQAGFTTDTSRAEFSTCLKAQPYINWSTKVTDTFQQAGLQGTPTLQLDGKTIDFAKLVSFTDKQDIIDFLSGKTTTYETK